MSESVNSVANLTKELRSGERPPRPYKTGEVLLTVARGVVERGRSREKI